MPQDEGLDDPPFPDTLSALGGVPAPPRRDRVVGWLQWAAAPLGFSVFLVGLTLFGLLKDEPTTEAGSFPAVTTPAPRSTATPSVATSAPPAPTPTAAPTTEPPTTQPPATDPMATEPPATEPTPEPQPVGPSAGGSPSPRFGPVCGHPPGQMFEIVINGQPAPPVTADASGCVTVDR